MTLSQRQRVILNCEQKSIRKAVVAGLRVCSDNPLKKQGKNLERLSSSSQIGLWRTWSSRPPADLQFGSPAAFVSCRCLS